MQTPARASRGARWAALVTLLLLGSLQASCSGERRIFKPLAAPRGLAILDAGLTPSEPRALERSEAWADIRDASAARIFIAHVDSIDALADDFELSEDLFSIVELDPIAAPDEFGQVRFAAALDPRPSRRILFYFFEADDAAGSFTRFPGGGAQSAIAVGSNVFDIDFAWPAYPIAFETLECAADLARYNPNFSGGGFLFEEIKEPIWVELDNTVILANSAGVTTGIGAEINGEYYFYPMIIMLWNEVANSILDGVQTVMSYCPLTDTSMFFSHENDYRALNFEVGGLFNSNLVVIDPHKPQSKIPQMLAFGVDGRDEGSCVNMIPSYNTSFGFWVRMHPTTKILEGDDSLDGFQGSQHWMRRHNPYHEYWRDNEEIRAPISHPDAAHPFGLRNKDRVFGVIGEGNPSAYLLPPTISEQNYVYNDDAGARPIVVFYVSQGRVPTAFDRRLPESGELLSFRLAQASYRGVPLFEDDRDEPSLWTLEGVAIHGPLQGQRLAWLPSMRAFWFAWHTMYPDSRLVDPLAEVAP